MIKNATIYRLPAPWAITAEELIGHLTPQAFAPCTALDFQTLGWIPPREHGQLVHSVNRQFLLRLQSEKKILPANVINQVTKARAAELEEQQGFPPGRRQTKELKEQVTDELLPRAFSTHRSMLVWIDPVNGWLVCDAASPSRAEEALTLLLKAIPKFPLETLRTVRSPLASMTDWLASDEAPSGFTVDQETELRATGEGKATVRFTRHTLEVDDTRRHIEGGKQCTRLAMTWRDKISFILTANMTIKRIVPLDVLKEDIDITSRSDDERFDGNVMLMTGELAKVFDELVSALGGKLVEDEQ
nr:MAG TPA: putative exonuclease [Caudoviricetes sp.]